MDTQFIITCDRWQGLGYINHALLRYQF